MQTARVNQFMRLLFVMLLLFTVWQSGIVLIAGTMNRQIEQIVGDNLSIADLDLVSRQFSRFPFIEETHPHSLYLGFLTSADESKRLGNLQKLIKLRPVSALAHAQTFSELLVRGEVDSVSLKKAVTLGRWEPEVLDVIIERGTRYWLRLGLTDREIVIAAAGRRLVHSSRWYRDSTIRILKARGFLEMACSSIQDEDVSECKNV